MYNKSKKRKRRANENETTSNAIMQIEQILHDLKYKYNDESKSAFSIVCEHKQERKKNQCVYVFVCKVLSMHTQQFGKLLDMLLVFLFFIF